MLQKASTNSCQYTGNIDSRIKTVVWIERLCGSTFLCEIRIRVKHCRGVTQAVITVTHEFVCPEFKIDYSRGMIKIL